MKYLLLFSTLIFSVQSLIAQNTPWSTTGNIGIGTANPFSKFHVYGENATLWGITLGYGTNSAVITTDDNTKPISFQIGNTEYMRISNNGTVGINTTNTFGYQLAINGAAIATSMTVKLNANWPDYVFKKDYKLSSLSILKSYIEENHHLPEIPSEQDIESKGLDLGEMNRLLVKKVEELTLYMIEKDKAEDLQREINYKLSEQIKAELNQIKNQNDELKDLQKKIIQIKQQLSSVIENHNN